LISSRQNLKAKIGYLLRFFDAKNSYDSMGYLALDGTLINGHPEKLTLKKGG
jgi:hypothetical protein